MNDTTSQFVGGIPENYDRFLGPNIFAYYAAEIASHAAAAAPEHVLELAAGSGIVTRALRDLLPKDAALTATDLNEPMLDVAADKFGADEAVAFQVADAQALPFEDNAFDMVVCQFGVMFFPDRVAHYREVARVLKPGGRYLFSSWGTNKQNPFSEISDRVLAECFPEDPPGFYKVPFFYNDPVQVRGELAQAGLRDPIHTATAHARVVPDLHEFAHGLIFGNPAIAEVEARGGDPAAVRDLIADRMRARFGTEPSPMPLLAHMFEVHGH